MRSLKAILALILFVLFITTFIFADDSKVRVTAARANIRLRPTTQSSVVSCIPLGAVLEMNSLAHIRIETILLPEFCILL